MESTGVFSRIARKLESQLGKYEKQVYEHYRDEFYASSTYWRPSFVINDCSYVVKRKEVCKISYPPGKKRIIDLVHKLGEVLFIVEFKRCIDTDAVGQVLIYKLLLEKILRGKSRVKVRVSGIDVYTDVEEYCRDNEIEVFLY